MRDLIGFAMMAVVVTPFAFLVFGLPLYGLRRRLDPFLDLMALVALVLIVSVAPAMAQAVASVPVANADTLFHIPPLVWTEINELLVGLFLAIGAGVWKWIDAHSPLKKTQAEEISRNAFQALLLTGAKFGLSQLKGQEEKVGDINVGNPAVAAAANFVIAHGPALAAKIGVDVSTADGQAAIIRSVTARLSMLLPGNVVVQPGGAVEDVHSPSCRGAACVGAGWPAYATPGPDAGAGAGRSLCGGARLPSAVTGTAHGFACNNSPGGRRLGRLRAGWAQSARPASL
jgi:hypothetical protein